MSEKHYIVIGNGPAGQTAALTLREKDTEARITILSRERHSHYEPRLLPAYIAGGVRREEVVTTPYATYEENGIKLRTGQKVVGLDPVRRAVHLEHRETLGFTGLIIAVGGRPRLPERFEVFQDLMLPLKTLADADRWRAQLGRTDTVVIIGGDLTSFAVTRALLSLGKKVRFVFSEGAFWPRRCTNEILEQASGRLKESGVEVVEGRLRGITRESDGDFKVFTDCAEARGGIVGAFFGLVPDVRFLAGSGLTIERGVLVDENLKTDFDRVYAAGDCAQVYHPELRDYWVSIGYDNACRLGRIAAVNLTGGLENAWLAPEGIFMEEGVKANTSWWMEFSK